jgi:hypothetical protein
LLHSNLIDLSVAGFGGGGGVAGNNFSSARPHYL